MLNSTISLDEAKADFLGSRRGLLFNVAYFVDQTDQNQLFLSKYANTAPIDPAARFRIKAVYNETYKAMIAIAEENGISISTDPNDEFGKRRRLNSDGEVIAVAAFATAVVNAERSIINSRGAVTAYAVGLKAWQTYLERFVVQKYNRNALALSGGFGRGFIDFLTQAMRQPQFDLDHMDAVVFNDPVYMIACAKEHFQEGRKIEAKITNYLAHRYNLQAPRANDKRRVRLARPLKANVKASMEDDREQLDPVWS